MQKQTTTPLFIDMVGAKYIAFHPSIAVAVEIEIKFVAVFRFAQLHINLPGNAFKSVHHGAGTHVQLYPLDPAPRDIGETVKGRKSPYIGHILAGDLHIGSGQSKHFYLPGSGHRIGKPGIHRRIGFKAFREITTGRLGQFFLVDVLNIIGTAK